MTTMGLVDHKGKPEVNVEKIVVTPKSEERPTVDLSAVWHEIAVLSERVAAAEKTSKDAAWLETVVAKINVPPSTVVFQPEITPTPVEIRPIIAGDKVVFTRPSMILVIGLAAGWSATLVALVWHLAR